jgi:hypothetical protein
MKADDALFPERGDAEVTCGRLYDADTDEPLGPASEQLTYLSLLSKYRWCSGGIIRQDMATHLRRVYVKDGRVQHKVTGRVWT